MRQNRAPKVEAFLTGWVEAGTCHLVSRSEIVHPEIYIYVKTEAADSYQQTCGRLFSIHSACAERVPEIRTTATLPMMVVKVLVCGFFTLVLISSMLYTGELGSSLE